MRDLYLFGRTGGLGKSLCMEMLLAPMPDDLLPLKVSDVIASDGTWDLQHISFFLSLEKLEEIKATPLSMVQPMDDFYDWGLTKNGIFSVSSAHEAVVKQQMDGVPIESVEHAFPMCPFAKQVWDVVSRNATPNELLDKPFKDWIKYNCLSHMSVMEGHSWGIIFVTTFGACGKQGIAESSNIRYAS
ncbi:hypothetical protein REPUB_Repub13aG0121900 [Reevesia pubescens]